MLKKLIGKKTNQSPPSDFEDDGNDFGGFTQNAEFSVSGGYEEDVDNNNISTDMSNLKNFQNNYKDSFTKDKNSVENNNLLRNNSAHISTLKKVEDYHNSSHDTNNIVETSEEEEIVTDEFGELIYLTAIAKQILVDPATFNKLTHMITNRMMSRILSERYDTQIKSIDTTNNQHLQQIITQIKPIIEANLQLYIQEAIK